jgi:hypothetical protein
VPAPRFDDERVGSAFGLAGYAFTKLLKNADLLPRKLEVGMLWMNVPAMPCAEMPFGGIKDSGYGSEGEPEAVDAYFNARSVAIANVQSSSATDAKKPGAAGLFAWERPLPSGSEHEVVELAVVADE